MRVDGACHCGRISFEAEVDPSKVCICHCTDCQTLTGSAFRVTVATPSEGFRIRSGTPKVYVKTAESGARRAQGFCADCGTPIFSTTADRTPTSYGIRVGTLRQRGELQPARQIWRRSALPWVSQMSELRTDEKDG